MRVVVFNDHRVDWKLHAGSEQGINGETHIPAHSGVTFEGPDGSEVFVKVWARMVMVRFEGDAMALAPVAPPPEFPPHPRSRRRSSMPTDSERMNIEAEAGWHSAVRDLSSRGRIVDDNS